MDIGVRGCTGAKDGCECVSRHDVQSSQGEDGNDEIMADHKENA